MLWSTKVELSAGVRASYEVELSKLTEVPSQEVMSSAWTSGIKFHGRNVWESVYGNDGAQRCAEWLKERLESDRDIGVDVQEVYLGYDIDTGEFIMGFDVWATPGFGSYGDDFNMGVAIVVDGNGRPLRILSQSDEGLFYRTQYLDLCLSMKDTLVHVRLA